MGKSKISWTEHTWNPLRVEGGRWGCTKVSPGCLNCYASRLNNRFGGKEYDYKFTDWKFCLDEKILMEPVRRKKPTIYFVCSVCDLFHEKVPCSLIDSMLEVVGACPQHRFLLLTKRPHLIDHKLFDITEDAQVRELGGGDYFPNVWIGTSVENQEVADKRIGDLLQIDNFHLFLSCEPLLSKVDLMLDLHTKDRNHIEWVIVGGESGPNFRWMDAAWVGDIAAQCARANVPLFVKQDCGPRSGQRGKLADHLWAKKDNPVCNQ